MRNSRDWKGLNLRRVSVTAVYSSSHDFTIFSIIGPGEEWARKPKVNEITKI